MGEACLTPQALFCPSFGDASRREHGRLTLYIVYIICCCGWTRFGVPGFITNFFSYLGFIVRLPAC